MTVDARLQTLLVRQLAFEWSEVNRDNLGGALRPPVIELSDAQRKLGSWSAGTRTLSLSHAFVHGARWGQVIEVLKHEMAHQYVSEVLGQDTERPHGDAFAHACRRLGIDPVASGIVPGSGERHPIVRRIEKLLALSQSDNPHESAAALERAHRLMLEHNVAVGANPAAHFEMRQVGPAKLRFQAFEKVLAGVLSKHFFVKVVWARHYLVDRGKMGRVLEIVGAPENVDFAAWSHDFLRYTAGRQWREHKRKRRIRGDADRQRFLAGFMFGVDDQLEAQTEHCAETGLVWVGDAALDAHMRTLHPRLRSSRRTSVRVNASFDLGAAEGRKIQLRRPVEGRSGGPRLLTGRTK